MDLDTVWVVVGVVFCVLWIVFGLDKEERRFALIGSGWVAVAVGVGVAPIRYELVQWTALAMAIGILSAVGLYVMVSGFRKRLRARTSLDVGQAARTTNSAKREAAVRAGRGVPFEEPKRTRPFLRGELGAAGFEEVCADGETFHKKRLSEIDEEIQRATQTIARLHHRREQWAKVNALDAYTELVTEADNERESAATEKERARIVALHESAARMAIKQRKGLIGRHASSNKRDCFLWIPGFVVAAATGTFVFQYLEVRNQIVLYCAGAGGLLLGAFVGMCVFHMLFIVEKDP